MKRKFFKSLTTLTLLFAFCLCSACTFRFNANACKQDGQVSTFSLFDDDEEEY